jgi:hypothetical protein
MCGNTTPSTLHPANCDVCRTPICGVRFKCLDCVDYDMCSDCVVAKRNKHNHEHEFIALHDPMRNIVVHIIRDDDGLVIPEADVGAQTSPGSPHNAFCDTCNRSITGVRWKCIDCVDFDMCSACMLSTRAVNHRNGQHKFVRITSPGEIFVHRMKESERSERDGARTPRARAANESSSPVPEVPPVPVSTNGPTAQPAVHDATCNLCDSRILGVRYKCTGCPDFDTCSNCFS